MKRLIKQNGRNYQTLYHYTSLHKLFNILKTDSLNTSNHNGNLSLTRDSNFRDVDRSIGSNCECRIALDGEKITQNYKLTPYHDKNFFGPKNIKKPVTNESEEISIQNIQPIKPYIKGITIYKDSVIMYDFNNHIDHYLTNDEYDYWKEADHVPESVIKEQEDWWDQDCIDFDEPSPKQKWYDEHNPKELTFDDAIKMIKYYWRGGITIV